MTDSREPDSTAVPFDWRLRLNALNDQFEAGRRVGTAPPLESLLADVNGTERAFLLRRLLALELEWRGREGETPDAVDYRRRFPDQIASIEEAFASSRRVETIPRRSAGSWGAGPFRQGEQVGGYRIEKQLGVGGMGIVLLARQLAVRERAVAIKCIQPQFLDGMDQHCRAETWPAFRLRSTPSPRSIIRT
mgnify:CR=1 FL=1